MSHTKLHSEIREIKMVDLKAQIEPIRQAIDLAIADVIDDTSFIKGAKVAIFEQEFRDYNGTKHVITCGNGTDALQIALMSLDLDIGDEVIIPAFAYAAVAEVILLLKLVPVLVDVDSDTFNIDVSKITKSITPRTKVIIPVHLFGQMADMATIMNIADEFNLKVIEDNAQSIGSTSKKTGRFSGTIGHIGCTSFFPSKNLGCFGDGGAITTDNDELAQRTRMITTHGQQAKYYHEIIGVNSRFDAIQAAILSVKLPHLNEYATMRREAADIYDSELSMIKEISIPIRSEDCTHVFHQYTLKVGENKRDALKEHLSMHKIPSAVYYPLPLHRQSAYKSKVKFDYQLTCSDQLCDDVLSLPMHTALDPEQLSYITATIKDFFG